jgi:hypothetical protein
MRVAGAASGSLDAVTVHRGTLVAGGCTDVAPFGCLFSPDARAALWISHDGRTWSRTMLPNGAHSRVESIRSIGRRLIVLGGEFFVEEDPYGEGLISTPVSAAIWLGPGPRHLRRESSGSGPIDVGEANDAVSLGGRLTVAGSSGACALFAAKVGAGWVDEPIDLPCGTADFGLIIGRVARFDGGAYATGSDLSEEGGLPVLFTPDARSWTTIRSPAFERSGWHFDGLDFASWRGKLIVVGAASDGTTVRGAIWIGDPRS